MSFDAGSIEASLTVDTSKADADLDKFAAKVKALEDGRHEIKVSAVFDQSSLSRARKAFADLDNLISRDAMQRLRSSPQGSVLGALNALFSPHPVTGGPSAQQSASKGLLGQMFSSQSGGNTNLPGGSGSSNTTSTNTVRNVVTGQNAPQSATEKVRLVQEGGAPQPGTATEDVKLVQEGAAPQPGETTEKVKLEADTSDLDRESKDAGSKSGDTAGRSWTGKFGAALAGGGITAAIGRIFGGGGGGIADTAGKSGGASGSAFTKNFGAQLAGGIGPLILGLKLKMAAIGTAASVGLAALPALAGLIGTGMGVAMVGGLVAEAVKGNAQIKAQFKAVGTDLTSTLAKAAAPLIPALSKVLGQVPALIKSLEPALAGIFKVVAPQIQGIFNGLKPIVTGLVSVMQAAAPAFGPFIGAIEKLVSSLLPGIAIVIRATVPVLTQFGQIMGTLGKNLGGLFSAAAPAIKASMTVLGALLGLIGGLLPILVKLGDVFATALAPVITQFAAAIKALTPFLTTIGKVIGTLAGAVLGDLVSAFSAVAQLLQATAPAFTSFANALSGVFTLLENSGFFATLGDALENVVPLVAQLVDALLNGLTPLLPPLLSFFTQISNILITQFSGVLTQILPPLTQLATTVLSSFAASLPVVLPVLTELFKLFTMATAGAIVAIVKALAGFVNAIPKPVLDTLAGLATTLLILKKVGSIVVGLGVKVVGTAQKILSWLMGRGGSGTVDVASAGMQKAGDTMADAAAAMNKAADKMAGAGAGEEAGGAEAAAGGGAAATGGGAAAGFTATLRAALPAVSAGVIVGAVIKAVGDALSPKGTLAGELNNMFQALQIQALQSFTFGGLEGWLTAKVGEPVGQFENTILSGAKIWALDVSNAVTGAWQTMAAGAAMWWGDITSTLSGFWGNITGGAAQWIGNVEQTISGGWATILAGAAVAWSGLVASITGWLGTIGGAVTTFFTSTLPAPFTTFWGWLQGWGGDLSTFFTVTVPGFFASLGADAVTFFGSTLPAPFTGFWSWVQGWGGDLETFFTATIPGYFTTAVSAIARAWSGLESAVSGPVNWVITNVLQPLANAFDDITSALGLGKPIGTIPTIGGGGGGEASGGSKQTSKAAHGMKVTQGTGPTADDVLIRVSKGETVVSAADSRTLAPLFAALGVPGYAAGGIVVDTASALLAIATGNTTALANDIRKVLPSGTGGATGEMAAVISKMPAILVTDIAKKLISVGKSEIGGIFGSGGGGGGGAGPAGTSGGAVAKLMQQMAAARGWTGALWNDLYAVEMAEAGFNPQAQNPGSGAYGLAQFINGPSEYAQYGGNSSTVAGQITGMLNYIAQRYGTPAAAWSHEQQYHWYDQGGWLKPGLTLAMNGTGQPEAVIPPGGMKPGGAYTMAQSQPETAMAGGGDLLKEFRALHSDVCRHLGSLTDVARAIPRGTGQHVGAALGGAAQNASFRQRYPHSGA